MAPSPGFSLALNPGYSSETFTHVASDLAQGWRFNLRGTRRRWCRLFITASWRHFSQFAAPLSFAVSGGSIPPTGVGDRPTYTGRIDQAFAAATTASALVGNTPANREEAAQCLGWKHSEMLRSPANGQNRRTGRLRPDAPRSLPTSRGPLGLEPPHGWVSVPWRKSEHSRSLRRALGIEVRIQT